VIQVILVGLAAWVVYETIRAAWPFTIPRVLLFVIVGGTCYGLPLLDPRVTLALASAAVASLAHAVVSLIGSRTAPVPIVPRLSRKAVRKAMKAGPGPVRRLPDLPK
jgi:hypothetical protein